jgi:hypothetical protein
MSTVIACLPEIQAGLTWPRAARRYHTLFEWKHTYGRKHEAVILPPVSVAVAHFKWTSTVDDKLRRREDEFKKQVQR